MERPTLEPAVLIELHRGSHRYRRHAGRLAVFLLLYAAAAFAAFRLAGMADAGIWVYLACIPLYLLAAASLHGVSLFTHEAVHGTLCANPISNHFFGAACAIPVLQNFTAYRVLHLKHHEHLGLQGDPDHYDNYTHWTWLIFVMHWGRLIIGYPAYITAIPILGFLQGNRRERFWVAVEVLAAAAMIAGALASPLPRALLFHGWLIPMLIINTLVNIRGMSQHTLLEHQSDDILGTRSILTGRVAAFFMCNENYHLEHHLYPGVPWYNLPRLHAALRDDLRRRGAPFISSYSAFVRDFVTGSLARSPWGRRGRRSGSAA